MKKIIISSIIAAVIAPSAMAYVANPESGEMTFTREIRAVSGVRITKDAGSILFANESESFADAGKFKIVSNTSNSVEHVDVITDKSGIPAHGSYDTPTVTYLVNGLGSFGEADKNIEVEVNREFEVIPQIDKYESELKEGTAKIITTIRLVAPTP